jgi:hypothetical protein
MSFEAIVLRHICFAAVVCMLARPVIAQTGFTLDSRRGYLSSTLSGRHVYSLFSGRTEREAGKAMSFGCNVLVFTFDGKIRRILRLDADVIAMADDDSETEIFALALAHDPHPRILHFKIPKLLDTP